MIRNHQKHPREILPQSSFPRHLPGTVRHVGLAGFLLDAAWEPSWKCLQLLELFPTLHMGGSLMPGQEDAVPGHSH